MNGPCTGELARSGKSIKPNPSSARLAGASSREVGGVPPRHLSLLSHWIACLLHLFEQNHKSRRSRQLFPIPIFSLLFPSSKLYERLPLPRSDTQRAHSPVIPFFPSSFFSRIQLIHIHQYVVSLSGREAACFLLPTYSPVLPV